MTRPFIALFGVTFLNAFQLVARDSASEFIRTSTTSEPKSQTVLEQGLPVHIVDEPSADFVRHNELDGIFLTRFREALSSEDWVLSGFTERSHRREVIDAELVATMDNISFLHSRVGTLRHVEIKLSSVESLFLRMKWVGTA